MGGRPRRVLVIGAGSIGERHARCFQRTQRAEVSVCELNSQLLNEVSERYHLRKAFANLESAIEDPPDAAVVCTPANLHVPMSQQLADANINLLIEKPLSISLDDTAKLAASIERNKLVAGVAYVQRMNPVLQDMRGKLLSGAYGDPVQLVFQSGQHFPLYRPAYREIYYTDRRTGGGAIQDALTHMVNTGEWFLGPITELVADADHLVLEGVDVEDTVHLIARHGSVMACYQLNQHQAPNESRLTIVCRGGAALAELHRGQWSCQSEPGSPWEGQLQVVQERDDMFVAQANMFLDALEGGELSCSVPDAIQTLRVNLAVLASVESRSWQRVEN